MVCLQNCGDWAVISGDLDAARRGPVVRGRAGDRHHGLLAALPDDREGLRIADDYLNMAGTVPHHHECHAGQHPATVHPALDADPAPVSSLRHMRSQGAGQAGW